MSEIMRPIPFAKLMDWACTEYDTQKTIFGVHEKKFYKNQAGTKMKLFGEEISSPVGPAAGPNSQLAQNIIASYLGGSRFVELKTVQIMDGAELSACVPRPCINAEDECYNVEWSTELTVPQAFDEYVKGWFAIRVLAKELGISDTKDFAYNMSVGYDLEGIKSEKIDRYIKGMKDASKTAVWQECIDWLKANISKFKNVTLADIESFEPCICTSITLSTLHGCPPDEIERIARYLLEEKGVHTYVKCNPTLLGYEFARNLLDSMGYGYISFDDHHFNDDLHYEDAVTMFKRLMDLAAEKNLAFGVKITNTFPVEIHRGELPGEEMYMSGRSLYPLSLNVAAKLSQAFNGKLPISFSGGADAFNIEELFATGVQPITVATTILKPGGYERLNQLATLLESSIKEDWKGIDVAALQKLADNVSQNENHRKEKRYVDSRKTKSALPLYDCFKAPCSDGGCPIEQQIPQYLKEVAAGNYKKAFDIIAIDNAVPSVTGTICNHNCQAKCTRLDYDDSLQIRAAKLIASENAQKDYIASIKAPPLRTDKKAVVIGAGPAGIAAALYLRRNGVAVTVLEKRDGPFGIVKYVIPAFRIPEEAMERDFEMSKAMGVEYQFNYSGEANVQELKKEYDFVVLAIGAWKEGASPVREGYENMRDALDFLEESKVNDCKVDLGKTVAVIGGGDVAMDCARAAKHAPGVEKVVIVYRRTMEFMPAEHEEILLAKEDGVEFMELLGPASCNPKTLICEKMVLTDWDSSGRRGVSATGEMVTLGFDTVIAATGARVDSTIFQKNNIEIDAKGRPTITAAGESSIANVYIAGDCKAGPSTIVAAMGDSKAVAKDILKKLNLTHDFSRVDDAPSFDELIDRKGILQAAKNDHTDGERCLACDSVCEVCVDVCPNRANLAITVSGKTDPQQIVHVDGMCNECGNCGVFCPHTGNPYKDKLTLFWTEEDFVDSTNRGWLKLDENCYKIRLDVDHIVEVALEDAQVPEEMRQCIEAVNKEYAYLY